MASSIVTTGIDATYPVAGQDNDSQGFRDNFSQIKKVRDDFQMNKLLWKEYDDFKYTIKIKATLLKLGLYPFIKKLYKLVS